MSTKDIINAIEVGDATAMMTAFENAMMSRVAVKLDDLRVQTAQNMFKTSAPVEVAEAPVDTPTE